MFRTCSIGAAVIILTLSIGGGTPPGAVRAAAAASISQSRSDPISGLLEVPVSTCDAASGFDDAARRNGDSVRTMSWSPFGRAEKGWAIYAPHVARAIGTHCAPESTGFAAALARWQVRRGFTGDGRTDVATLMSMKGEWQAARPYVALRASGVCPAPPASTGLTRLSAEEGYLGKSVEVRSDVARAYRRMLIAAKAELPELAEDPQLLRVFSGYRSPAYDDARCARDGNCGGVVRAKCSVHRTGQALDLVVGAAPGFSVDSSADANRLHQSQGRAYRWLLANAERFGFVNYSFEPWHWEWIGDGARPDTPQMQQVANR